MCPTKMLLKSFVDSQSIMMNDVFPKLDPLCVIVSAPISGKSLFSVITYKTISWYGTTF